MGDVPTRRPYRQAKPPARSAPPGPSVAGGRMRRPMPRSTWAPTIAAADRAAAGRRLCGRRCLFADRPVGEGLATTGRLSDAAIDRTIAALRVCADKLKRRNVTLSRAVATEACRRAANGPAFIARALAETGISPGHHLRRGRGAPRRARLPRADRAGRGPRADLRHRRRFDRAGIGRHARAQPPHPRLAFRRPGASSR